MTAILWHFSKACMMQWSHVDCEWTSMKLESHWMETIFWIETALILPLAYRDEGYLIASLDKSLA
jgi:hypothetical protein